ncbi:MAG: ArsR family transcriptional regulator [Planctomycetota bacterium]|nr:MAG: ArsR family transcriptional regulator [Planctomycetota bacterium]
MKVTFRRGLGVRGKARLGLVARLSARGPESIAGLAGSVDVSRQAVTKHLHVLSDAGPVRGFRRGRQHIWELEPGRLAKARDYLERIDAQWDVALERLEQFLPDE